MCESLRTYELDERNEWISYANGVRLLTFLQNPDRFERNDVVIIADSTGDWLAAPIALMRMVVKRLLGDRARIDSIIRTVREDGTRVWKIVVTYGLNA